VLFGLTKLIHEKMYCPYRDYYKRQAGLGSSFPVFEGAEFQRGHGLGSLFSSLFRSSLPLLKRAGLYLGKQAVRTGLDIAQDAVNNRNIGESAKEHFKSMGNRIVDDAKNQIGQGTRRRAPPIKRKRRAYKKPVRRLKRDIFD